MLPRDGADATSFQPSWAAGVEDPTPGASSTLTFDLNLSSPHSQFASLVSFIPAEFGITTGDDVTNGAIAGHINAVARLGLINGACDSTLVLGFDLMDASTDPAQTIYLYDGVNDWDGDGLPENVDRYPSTLATLAPDLVPIQRLYGQIPVAGTLVPLNLITFAPGTPIPGLPTFDPTLGYPVVTMLGDPFYVPYPDDDSITDYCTPLSATVNLFGVTQDHTATPANEAGQVLRTNPAQPGTYNSIIFARSQWDADNDGIENTLDTCPVTPDPGWNPRTLESPGDADDDGLADSCDTNDNSPNADQDGDGFFNRGDGCPTLIPQNFLHYDKDRDAIGDECDPFPEDPSNGGAAHRHAVCASDTFTIGVGGPGPPPWSCPSGPDLPTPPRLVMNPPRGIETVGSVLSLRVFARRINAAGAAIAHTVSFQVTGANAASGSCLTDNFGECTFNYQGVSAGLDTITASATIDGFDLTDTSTGEFFGPPGNDNFEAAAPVGSLPFADEPTPVAADNETGEPKPCGGSLQGGVWYSFTPGEDVLLTAEAESNGGPLVLAAYTGASLAELQLVQCDSTYQPGPVFPGGQLDEEEYDFAEYVAFKAKAGVTYHFQVGWQFGLYGSEPEIEFSLNESVMGDVNCSDTLNSLDALGVLRIASNLPKPACHGNGDVNCNEIINALDALTILRAAAGLLSQPLTCPA
jgi:hypothetical protein